MCCYKAFFYALSVDGLGLDESSQLSLLLTFVLVCIVWSCMPRTAQQMKHDRIGIQNFAAVFLVLKWYC
jgi:hypothetical protein